VSTFELLLAAIERATPADSGVVYARDGQRIPD
jgi:hypothetical protein